jgi:hypothetical protein
MEPKDVSADVAEEVLGWLQAGAELVEAQAPLLAQEILRFGLVSEIFGLVLFGATSIAIALYARYAARRLRNAKLSDWDLAFGLAALCSAFFGILAVASLHGIIKILVAPRLYLLEQLADLL